MKEIDNTKATASYIGMSESWLRQSRLRGDGPPFFKIGRSVRYQKPQIDAWLEDHRRSNTIHRAC